VAYLFLVRPNLPRVKPYVAIFVTTLSLLASVAAQDVDLKKYAVDAHGTILQVVPGSGILSKNTRGLFGPLHPDPRTSGKEVFETIDPRTGEHISTYEVRTPHKETSYTYNPLDNMGRGGRREETRTVDETQWVRMPWVRTPVEFPELIFISVDTRGLIDDAHWGPWTIYETGTYSYTSPLGVIRTVKKYTVNPRELIDIMKGPSTPSPSPSVSPSATP
jgi:hypothetical protein